MSALDFRIGSLFAGIGGLELGLEWAGVGHTVFQVEREPYCRAVLAKHWPDVQRFDDVCTVGAHNLPAVDVLCGGFPCQDISQAGRRAGIEGKRSGLWSEYARIVSEIRPRYVVVENVAALLVRGVERVLGDLAALGYDAEWHCIPAAAVGAPHYRDRIWIVAYPQRERPAARTAGEGGDARRDRLHHADGHRARRTEGRALIEPRARGRGEALADAHGDDEHGRRGDVQMGRRWLEEATARNGHARGAQWRVEPDLGRVAHGVPSRVDRLTALGNAVVPQVAEVVGRVIVARELALREATHAA